MSAAHDHDIVPTLPKCPPAAAGLSAVAGGTVSKWNSFPMWNAAHRPLPFKANRNSNRNTPELETCPNA